MEVLALYCEERYGIFMNSLANIEVVATVSNIEVKAAVAVPKIKVEAVPKKAAIRSGNTSSKAVEITTTDSELATTDETEGLAGEGDISVEAEAELGAEAGAGETGEAAPGESAESGEEFAGETSEDLILDETAGMDAGLDDGMFEGGLEGDFVGIDPIYGDGMDLETGTIFDPAAEAKGSLLSSWTFVIGISSAVLVVSIALGALLARRKIKKGIELYED